MILKDMLRALATGEYEAFRSCSFDARDLKAALDGMAKFGLGRLSRRGWLTLDVPGLGTMQWKSGETVSVDLPGEKMMGAAFTSHSFLTPYLFVRINGRMVLKCYPENGQGVSYARWVAVTPTTPHEIAMHAYVERLLGSVEHGTDELPSVEHQFDWYDEV